MRSNPRRRQNPNELCSGVEKCFLSDVEGNYLDPLVPGNIICKELPQQGGRKEKTVYQPDGTPITLQQVRIIIKGFVTVILDDSSRFTEPFAITENYLLCAPPGTSVLCDFFDFECDVITACSNGKNRQLDITITLCQNVQTEAKVNLAISGRLCTPRERPENLSVDEELCIKGSKVFDWVQREIKITIRPIPPEPVCVYKVILAEGDCNDITKGDLICLPCEDPYCEQFFVCNNADCFLILERTERECQFCPPGGKSLPIGVVCDLPEPVVYNVEKAMFYPTIQEAIDNADDGNTLIVFPGDHIQSSFLLINKPLTIRGLSADLTRVIFPDALINTTSLRIQSDNVTIDNIHFIGPTSQTSGTNALFEIPFKAFGELYTNITIKNSIIEGGRRNAFIRAENLTILNTRFIHTGNRNSLQISNAQGTTTIAENTFTGGPDSRAALTFENGEGGFNGSFNIEDNTVTRHSQFVLFNLFRFNDVSIFVLRNQMNHEDRSGSSIIFIPIDFTEANPIIIEENEIINPNPSRLAVFVDYRFGGTSVPEDDQIEVISNIFDVALPWGTPTDTVDSDFPVGFSENAPPAMSLDAFKLEGNIVINP